MKSTQWKLAFAAAVLALTSMTAVAQQGPPPDEPGNSPHNQFRRGGGPERELNNLTRLLTLTPDQQTGVKALLEQQTSQARALHAKFQSESSANETPEAHEAHMTQMNLIRDETNTKIAALLDETQKPKFAEWVERRKVAMARRQQDGGPGGPPPPPQQ